MFEEFDMQSPFLNMAFADEIDMDFAEDFDGDELDPEELEQELEETAKELAALITKYVPEHVLCDFHHANALAMMPVLDTLIDALIEKGLMTAPENGVGAEGCWLALKK